MRGTPTIEAEAIPKALSPDKLFRRADLSGLASTTTRELPPAPVLAGQRRAEEAIRLGTALAARGFNIFATGRPGARISSSSRKTLETVQLPGTPPQDWVYANNFAVPHRPTAIGPAPRPRRADAAGYEKDDRIPSRHPAGAVRERRLSTPANRHRRDTTTTPPREMLLELATLRQAPVLVLAS